MAKKRPSTQFKRFASAMGKIVTVSKDELAKREAAYKRSRPVRQTPEEHLDLSAPELLDRPADK